MRIPTVTVRNKETGETLVVNETDYATGSLPSNPDIRLGSPEWERVNESSQDEAGTAAAVADAVASAEAARALEAREADGKAPE